MIHREISNKALSLFEGFPVLTITGPRQSGKTTLVKSLGFGLPYVSLEDPDNRLLASSDPRQFLSNFPAGAILDEVQQVPELFSYIQGVVDGSDSKFVLCGSQNFQLIESISQSLAGRTAVLRLMPLSLAELSPRKTFSSFHDYVFKGAYPRLYNSALAPEDFYPAYISTYVERDVRQVKNIDKLSIFIRFLKLAAGRIGQPLNYSNLANDVGVSPNTIQDWMSILEASYVVHLLQPYHQNLNKRIIKAPKLYFWDTGLACSLLGLDHRDQLKSFHMVGNLFENMVVNELLKARFNQGRASNLYFWQNRNRQEIDIVVDRPLESVAIEVKAGMTKSSSYWKNINYWQSLQSEESSAHVIYGGSESWDMSGGRLWSWYDLPEVCNAVK